VEGDGLIALILVGSYKVAGSWEWSVIPTRRCAKFDHSFGEIIFIVDRVTLVW
jgi:hypothetical protein